MPVLESMLVSLLIGPSMYCALSGIEWAWSLHCLAHAILGMHNRGKIPPLYKWWAGAVDKIGNG